MPSQILTYGWSPEGGANPINRSVSVEGEGAEQFSIELDAGETQEVAIAWANGSLQSIFITTTHGVALETNSPSAPQDEISLSPDSPFSWNYLSGVSDQFAGAVTSIFLTNQETEDCVVTIAIVRDATP